MCATPTSRPCACRSIRSIRVDRGSGICATLVGTRRNTTARPNACRCYQEPLVFRGSWPDTSLRHAGLSVAVEQGMVRLAPCARVPSHNAPDHPSDGASAGDGARPGVDFQLEGIWAALYPISRRGCPLGIAQPLFASACQQGSEAVVKTTGQRYRHANGSLHCSKRPDPVSWPSSQAKHCCCSRCHDFWSGLRPWVVCKTSQ